ncbi:MAG: guanylate kinase [Dehalococcoidia bacterium]|nr:guanylate kinase [Dehalococcoidia bacterium]
MRGAAGAVTGAAGTVSALPAEGEPPPPLVVVLSGPSGVGKDAVLDRLRGRFAVPVTMTTRAPRLGELNGRDYLFVDEAEFTRQLAAGELLEHARVYERSYGVPRAQLRAALASGHDVAMRVDVQGAATLRALLAEALFVFLVPDEPSRLEAHLRARGAEEGEALRLRLASAERELEERVHFDHVLVNVEGDLDGTVDGLLALVEAERARPGRQPVVA